MQYIRCRVCAVSLAICFSGSVVAQDQPKNFACTFATGSSWVYGLGGYKGGQPTAFSFDITSIDAAAQTAIMIIPGSPKTQTLRLFRAPDANHFLETAGGGSLTLTTIYSRNLRTGSYPAVHTRHLSGIGAPNFSQSAGMCSAK